MSAIKVITISAQTAHSHFKSLHIAMSMTFNGLFICIIYGVLRWLIHNMGEIS